MCIFHKWSKWGDERYVKIYSQSDLGIPISIKLVQIKICEKCGMKKSREIEV
jgi:hypothetical protein